MRNSRDNRDQAVNKNNSLVSFGAPQHHNNINLAAFKKTQMMSFRRQSNMLSSQQIAGGRSNSSRARHEESPAHAKFKDFGL